MKSNIDLVSASIARVCCVISLMILATGVTSLAHGQEENDNKGKLFGDFLLRYEAVEQDDGLEDADALTLRSSLGYKTASYQGFSALVEVENITEIVDDFSVPQIGIRSGEFSTIADPENTEIDQAYVQYSNNGLTARLGRQIFTLDNHRFVGSVAWRQDRQTYDALVLEYKPDEKWVINASYINKRNRIFGDDADVDSQDYILNTSYKTPIGDILAYAYLLEEDNNIENSLDTYGVRLSGTKPISDTKLSYTFEFASQESNDNFDAEYLLLELAANYRGVSTKIGYELLGSDNGQFGFTTPLATLHGFNGWADIFLTTPDAGLEDVYLSVSGDFAGGKWIAVYHDFSSDDSFGGFTDLGDELNLRYSIQFSDNYWAGIKYADYSAGDSAFNLVDSEKLWVWGRFAF